MGSEKVFEIFLDLYPQADVVTLWASDYWRGRLADRNLRILLGRPPQRRPELSKALALPLMPLAWQSVNASKYDLVLTSQHAFAHTLGSRRRARANLTYVHSTARYVWTPEIDHRSTARGLNAARHVLRQVDRRLARHHTAVAANSEAVRRRVRDHWGVDASVIHPPVNLTFLEPRITATASRGYLVGAGRWVQYKRPDLVIEVAEAMNLPVKLLGRGPMAQELRRRAANSSVEVEVIESPSDAVFRTTLAGAACLVQPAVEDFGIVTVEALAAGTPVASLGAGGALDILSEGANGALAPTQEVGHLAAATARALACSRAACVSSAQQFSESAFRSKVQQWVAQSVANTGASE